MSVKQETPEGDNTPAREPREAIDSERKAQEETRREERRPVDAPAEVAPAKQEAKTHPVKGPGQVKRQ